MYLVQKKYEWALVSKLSRISDWDEPFVWDPCDGKCVDNEHYAGPQRQ